MKLSVCRACSQSSMRVRGVVVAGSMTCQREGKGGKDRQGCAWQAATQDTNTHTHTHACAHTYTHTLSKKQFTLTQRQPSAAKVGEGES